MYALNTKIDGFETIIASNVLAKAASLKSDYPTAKRVIGVELGVIPAIAAAYKTASGIAEKGIVIADSIYSMRKLDIAMLIARNDDSKEALHRAAYELARDIFLTGDIEGKSEMLALASGASNAECMYIIERKLEKMSAELYRRTQHMSSIYADIYAQAPESPHAIKEEICKHGGKYLLNLPTAYGKTSEVLDPVVRESIDIGLKVLVISHRRSINANICANIPGMVSYDECTSPEIIKNARALKIVVNSLSADKFKAFIESADVVIIDEASQVISHVLGGEVKAREEVWNALNFVVKNAGTVVLADADINARCVALIDWDHTLYSLKRDHSDIKVKTADIEHVRGLVIEAAMAGDNVLVSCDGAKSAKALAAAIKKKAGIDALVITSENAKWSAQAAFIANPNSVDHQVVIYSPVITSALSITSGHFTRHFGLFNGNIVPSDAIQMLRRDRTAAEFIVGMKTPEYSKQEQLEALERRTEAPTTRAAIEAADIDESLKAVLIEALDFDIKPSAFEEMRYEHMSDEAWLRDNIQNSLPATLINQGFCVDVLEHSDEMARLGFVADSQGRKEVNTMAAEKIMASKAARADKVAQVKDTGSADEIEHFEVIRALAEDVIGRRELTKEDAIIWRDGNGEDTINRFRKMLSSDGEGAQGKIFTALKTAAQHMLDKKDWTAESSAALFDTLNAHRFAVIQLGMSIGKASTPKAKQAAITKLMSQLGLKTKKVNGGKSGTYYIIKKCSYDQMMKYMI